MTIRWLGQPAGCVLWTTSQPCPAGQVKVFDPQCPAGRIRCRPGAIESCANNEAFYDAIGKCVPITCFPGTVRDLSTFQCVAEGGLPTLGPLGPPVAVAPLPGTSQPPPPPPPAPGECLTTQQVVAAQPCFYVDQSGAYVGPPELVQGVDMAQLTAFCLQSLQAGYFDLPLCDPATLPPPPSCIDPETRRVLTYCAERGFSGDDRAANYFCWLGLKAPELLREWVNTQNCNVGEAPVQAPPAPPRLAEKRSAVVPLLLGAAVLGAAYYFLS